MSTNLSGNLVDQTSLHPLDASVTATCRQASPSQAQALPMPTTVESYDLTLQQVNTSIHYALFFNDLLHTSGWKLPLRMTASQALRCSLLTTCLQNRLVSVQVTGPGWILGTAVALMKFMAKVGYYLTMNRHTSHDNNLNTAYRQRTSCHISASRIKALAINSAMCSSRIWRCNLSWQTHISAWSYSKQEISNRR